MSIKIKRAPKSTTRTMNVNIEKMTPPIIPSKEKPIKNEATRSNHIDTSRIVSYDSATNLLSI